MAPDLLATYDDDVDRGNSRSGGERACMGCRKNPVPVHGIYCETCRDERHEALEHNRKLRRDLRKSPQLLVVPLPEHAPPCRLRRLLELAKQRNLPFDRVWPDEPQPQIVDEVCHQAMWGERWVEWLVDQRRIWKAAYEHEPDPTLDQLALIMADNGV